MPRIFGQHNVTAMGLFSRENRATGSEFHHYREDWVFRTTYNYAMRYFFEFNGAYNGSEKFDNDHRFAFFPSLSAGWMLSEEPFHEAACRNMSTCSRSVHHGVSSVTTMSAAAGFTKTRMLTVATQPSVHR
jgi:hypothetical protein